MVDQAYVRNKHWRRDRREVWRRESSLVRKLAQSNTVLWRNSSLFGALWTSAAAVPPFLLTPLNSKDCGKPPWEREKNALPEAANDDTSCACAPSPNLSSVDEPSDGRGRKLPICSGTLWFSHNQDGKQKGDCPSEIKPERTHEIKESEC